MVSTTIIVAILFATCRLCTCCFVELQSVAITTKGHLPCCNLCSSPMGRLPSYNFIYRKQQNCFRLHFVNKNKMTHHKWFPHNHFNFLFQNPHIHQEVSLITTSSKNSFIFFFNFSSKTILDRGNPPWEISTHWPKPHPFLLSCLHPSFFLI